VWVLLSSGGERGALFSRAVGSDAGLVDGPRARHHTTWNDDGRAVVVFCAEHKYDLEVIFSPEYNLQVLFGILNI